MRKYEQTLQSIKSWSSVVFGLIVVSGILFGFKTLITSVHKDKAIRDAEVAWCLDNGGRRVAIDGMYDCFQLTVVEDSLISRGFFDAPRSAQCKKRSDAVWVKVPDGRYNCFYFTRLRREIK